MRQTHSHTHTPTHVCAHKKPVSHMTTLTLLRVIQSTEEGLLSSFNPAQPWSKSLRPLGHSGNPNLGSSRPNTQPYLVEEVESSDVGLFGLEELPGDVQELLGLGALRGADTEDVWNKETNMQKQAMNKHTAISFQHWRHFQHSQRSTLWSPIVLWQ